VHSSSTTRNPMPPTIRASRAQMRGSLSQPGPLTVIRQPLVWDATVGPSSWDASTRACTTLFGHKLADDHRNISLGHPDRLATEAGHTQRG
jgi:hypothetical protein